MNNKQLVRTAKPYKTSESLELQQEAENCKRTSNTGEVGSLQRK